MNTHEHRSINKEKRKRIVIIQNTLIKTKAYCSLLLIFLSMHLSTYSQTPTADPNHYVLDTYDNFNTFNSSLWNSTPYYTWGQETYSPNNVTASNGVLTLKCEKIGNNYISGGIETVNKKDFSYGYFEIESKTPPSGNKGPWGGFWMHSGAGGGANELDIFEPNGLDNYYGTQYHIGLGVNLPNNNDTTWHNTIVSTNQNLSSGFHKYAVIWTPGYVQYLLDDQPVYEVVNQSYIPTHSMYVFLTFQIDTDNRAPDASTTFPLFWRYKNFKYYKLKTDCNTSIVQSNFNFINHDYKVYKSYTLTNSTVPANFNIVLRAKDYIQLNGEFTIPLGSTFTAITHRGICPE